MRCPPEATTGALLTLRLPCRIYIELSDRYRSMDAKLGGGKRRALAEHLKESIDTLEIKVGFEPSRFRSPTHGLTLAPIDQADQVKRLHDLLQ